MMSNNPRRQNQRRAFPWPLIAFGGVLLVVAAFFMLSGGGGGGTPNIAVDQQRIDFGTQKFNTELTFAIKVTNTGDGVLRFREEPFIEIVEGC